MLGIEKLKILVSLAISFPRQTVKTFKNKFQVFDILGFLDEFRQAREVHKERKAIHEELKDLSPEERAELLAYIKEEFDIPDDKLEVFIENALKWAESTLALAEQAKELWGKK